LKIIVDGDKLKKVEYCCQGMADCVTKRVVVLVAHSGSLSLNSYAVKWCPFCKEQVKYEE